MLNKISPNSTIESYKWLMNSVVCMRIAGFDLSGGGGGMDWISLVLVTLVPVKNVKRVGIQSFLFYVL